MRLCRVAPVLVVRRCLRPCRPATRNSGAPAVKRPLCRRARSAADAETLHSSASVLWRCCVFVPDDSRTHVMNRLLQTAALLLLKSAPLIGAQSEPRQAEPGK